MKHLRTFESFSAGVGSRAGHEGAIDDATQLKVMGDVFDNITKEKAVNILKDQKVGKEIDSLVDKMSKEELEKIQKNIEGLMNKAQAQAQSVAESRKYGRIYENEQKNMTPEELAKAKQVAIDSTKETLQGVGVVGAGLGVVGGAMMGLNLAGLGATNLAGVATGALVGGPVLLGVGAASLVLLYFAKKIAEKINKNK
jgi:hypothetical protein